MTVGEPTRLLIASMTSASLKNELLFARDSLIEAINKRVGSPTVTEIVFH